MSVCDKLKLSLYVDNMLDSIEMHRISEHLLECPDCRRYFGELNVIKSKLESFDEIKLPEGYHEQTMSLIRELRNEPIDFVTKRLKNTSVRKLRPIPKKQFWGQLGTVAAGLMLTLTLFGGLGSLVTAPNGAVEGAGGMYSGGDAYKPERYPVDMSAVMPEGANTEIEADIVMDAGIARAEQLRGQPQDVGADMPMLARRYDESEIVDDDHEEINSGIQSTTMHFAMNDEPVTTDSDSIISYSIQPMEQAIKHYSISIEVDDFNAALTAIGRLPGYNTNSTTYGGGGLYMNYNATRLVGETNYEWIKSELKSLGKVASDSESAQMVFADIVDTEARIRAKEVEMSRLFELLEQSDSVNSMVQITRQLEANGNVLESLRSRKLGYERGVADATVAMHIFSRGPAPQYALIESFGERLKASFTLSINITFKFIENAAVFITSIVFPLLALGFVFFIVYLIRRAGKRWRRRKNNENA